MDSRFFCYGWQDRAVDSTDFRGMTNSRNCGDQGCNRLLSPWRLRSKEQAANANPARERHSGRIKGAVIGRCMKLQNSLAPSDGAQERIVTDQSVAIGRGRSGFLFLRVT